MSDESIELQRDYLGKDGVSILPALLRPKSTGTIRLNSASYKDYPLIDPQYLKHPHVSKPLSRQQKL